MFIHLGYGVSGFRRDLVMIPVTEGFGRARLPFLERELFERGMGCMVYNTSLGTKPEVGESKDNVGRCR